MGFYEEEGIIVESVPINVMNDAFAALTSNQVDVLSTYGTSGPLQRIGSGIDLTIFGGYMLTGAMPIAARPGTEFTGVESLVGKKVGSTIVNYAVSWPLFEAGYDPHTDVEWVIFNSNMERLEALRAGEIDFGVISTGHEIIIAQMGLEVVGFTDDLFPDYSCCRIQSNTAWLNDNPDAVSALLRSWIRAQQIYESDIDYAVSLMARRIDVTEETARSFLASPHLRLSMDPFKDIVFRVWDICIELGLFDVQEGVNIANHVNTDLYKRALDECVAKYGALDPAFYEKLLNSFAEFNT